MNNLKEKTVAKIVAENIKYADVFKKYGIDFCCGGGISLESACQKHNINLQLIENELNEMNFAVLPSQNFNKWSLDFLADYIVQTHHSYVQEAIPIILAYAEKVAHAHGEKHPEVIEVFALFQKISDELLSHLMKEERILFPYIKQLSQTHNETVVSLHFDSVQNPISVMTNEHELAGEWMKQIRQITNQFTPPQTACNTFKALYAKLSEFEGDLHQHIHLENNILFPKSIELENKLRNE